MLLNRFLSRLKPILLDRFSVSKPNLNIMDWYVRSSPDPQNALDIFRGDWLSQLPEPFADLQAGAANLFEDARITWFDSEIGGVKGRSVLELGPLEGGHSYLLEKLGASSVISIEANTRAFLKCLIVKELLELNKVRFLLGDFVEYLREKNSLQFDLCVASGVLYHMQNPVELISLLAKHCKDHLLIWTHYYDPSIIANSSDLSHKFTSSLSAEHEGFKHRLHRHEYQSALEWTGFCGGTAPFSHWMSREDILKCLHYFGFQDLRIEFDHSDHPNGPAFAIIASRGGPPNRHD